MVGIKINLISIEEIPKTWRGKMFLIALLLMILVVAYALFNQSIFSIIAAIIMVMITIIIAFLTASENIPLIQVSNPKVKIEKVVDRVSRVSIAKTENHEEEIKVGHIDIENKNPDVDLTGCKIGIKTKLGDWNTMNLENLNPDIPKTIRLFRIRHDSSAVSLFESKNGVKLDVGKVHDLNIRFFGEKFSNKKIWHMELDLTSWDRYNLRFKTRRGILTKRIGVPEDE